MTFRHRAARARASTPRWFGGDPGPVAGGTTGGRPGRPAGPAAAGTVLVLLGVLVLVAVVVMGVPGTGAGTPRDRRT